MTPAARPYVLMARNNAWANAVLHAAAAGLSPEVFAAPRPGFFSSLAATLNHILAVDRYYLDALEAGGLGRSVYDAPQLSDPAALAEAQAAEDRRLIAFCEGLTESALQEDCATERAGGVVQETVEALLLHLFQHQIHHRGQAHVQLQEAGIAPPQLDEFYLNHDRAPSAEAFA
jgi:uncharacterized damage-inducible protein DinB